MNLPPESLHSAIAALADRQGDAIVIVAREPGESETQLPIVYANTAFSALSGKPASQLTGHDLAQAGSIGRGRARQALLSGDGHPFHQRCADASGAALWLDCRVVPITTADDSRDLVALTAHDITEEQELLEKTLTGSVRMLVDLLDLRLPGEVHAAARLRELAFALAHAAEVPVSWKLDLAATLSRIERLVLPRDLLARYDRGQHLAPDEELIILRGPQVAADVIGRVPRLEPVAEIVALQERGYDGSGVPDDAPKGGGLPIEARVLHLARSFLRRVDRGADPAEAVSQLDEVATRFDPALLVAGRPVLLAWHDRDTGDHILSVTLAELRTGDLLLDDLVTREGQKLLAGGQLLNDTLVAKLAAAGKFWRLPGVVRVRRPGISAGAAA